VAAEKRTQAKKRTRQSASLQGADDEKRAQAKKRDATQRVPPGGDGDSDSDFDGDIVSNRDKSPHLLTNRSNHAKRPNRLLHFAAGLKIGRGS